MSVYSIKDLEQLSGIKAHTIRIWEQRYNLFSPQRTETNIRFYSDEDLKLILNISTLRHFGYKISKIVEMSDHEIQEIVKKLSIEDETFHDQINALTVAMIDIDEPYFNEVLGNCVDRIGFQQTMIDVVYPLMKKIGVLWITNSINPAQEHFLTNLVRQRLIVETDKLELKKDTPTFLLYLPEGELHELGLLFANYIIRSEGLATVYFGQTVPLNAIEEIYYNINPEYVLTVITTIPEMETPLYVEQLKSKFRDSKVFVTGFQVLENGVTSSENIQVLKEFHQLLPIIQTILEDSTS